MNVMTVDDYHATIEFDPELDMFRGEILGLNGGADFYGKNPNDQKRRGEYASKFSAGLRPATRSATIAPLMPPSVRPMCW